MEQKPLESEIFDHFGLQYNTKIFFLRSSVQNREFGLQNKFSFAFLAFVIPFSGAIVRCLPLNTPLRLT